MKKNLMKVFLLVFVLSVLSVSAFADDLLILEGEDFNTFGSLTTADYGVESVTYSAAITSKIYANPQRPGSNLILSCSSDSPTYSETRDSNFGFISYSVGTVNMSAGTLILDLPAVGTDTSVSTSTAGASVSLSGSTLTIVSDGSNNPVALSFSGSTVDIRSLSSITLSSSFESSVDPSDGSGYPSGSMNGIQGNRYALSAAYDWEIYNEYIGVRKIMYVYQFQGADGGTNWTSGTIEGEELLYDLAVAMNYNGYKWKVDPLTGDLVFYGYDGGMAKSGSWLDMVFRYLTYDYYWGTRLWSNDVSGSWYGSISSSFSYLNYRVNQILQVLANDEDLQIKDATTSEREWVQDYFENGSDIADSSKYSSLNSDGQALKNFLTPSESKSMSDAIESVESGGYSFWSDQVYQDLYGSSSLATADVGEDVPWEQQINDLYSEHVNAIWGAFDD